MGAHGPPMPRSTYGLNFLKTLGISRLLIYLLHPRPLDLQDLEYSSSYKLCCLLIFLPIRLPYI